MLEARNVSVSYGRHRALEGAALRVGRGEICVILGANGAGKSTLLKTIAGMVRGEPGCEITMNGRRIDTMKPHRIVEEGIALVPEGRGIFGDLTVAENLQLGAFAARARNDEAASLRRIYDLFPRLAERKGQIVRTMSGGEQQMVAIGRALMSKPEILMLDEPSLGLSPLLCQELFRSLSEIAASGVGILLVEQNAKQSLKIAGRGYLIENGHVTGEASARDLMNDPAVINAYLGGAAGARAGTAPAMRLPSSMRLPAGLEAMGRLMATLAERAGRIHQAFIRSLRRGGELPSAFVGRYDPKAAADPWEALASEMRETAAPRRPIVSPEARRAGADAASLADRARERMAAHVATARLNAARPNAFAPVFGGLPEAAKAFSSPAVGTARRSDIALDAADLARRAGERLAAHVAAARKRGSGTAAFHPTVREAASRDHGREEQPIGQPVHGLIGHNSAGFEFEDEDGAKPPHGVSIAALASRAAAIHAAHVAARRAALPVAPARRAVDGLEPQAVRKPASTPAAGSIAELVARAAEVQAAHVATRRKALTAFTLQAGGASSTGTASKKHHASKKRKKHKEK
jgi:branched-chain amino acid transport system ATP-binding protein